MVAGQEDLAGLPAFLVGSAPALNLRLHWKAQELERFVPNMEIIGVALALHGHGAGFLMAVEAGEVPMVSEMDNNIGPLRRDVLPNPFQMVQRDAGADLGVGDNEVSARPP